VALEELGNELDHAIQLGRYIGTTLSYVERLCGALAAINERLQNVSKSPRRR
jgi:hypothetical protein